MCSKGKTKVNLYRKCELKKVKHNSLHIVEKGEVKIIAFDISFKNKQKRNDAWVSNFNKDRFNICLCVF